MIGRFVAYVHPVLDTGPILYVEGAFTEECQQSGWDIGDHGVGMPPHCGLLAYEGIVQLIGDPEPDVYLAGKWRPLTHWELSRLWAGMPPFGEPLKPYWPTPKPAGER